MRQEKIKAVRAKLRAGHYDDPSMVAGMLTRCLDDLLYDLKESVRPTPKNPLATIFYRARSPRSGVAGDRDDRNRSQAPSLTAYC